MRRFKHAQNRKTLQWTNVYKASRKEQIVYESLNIIQIIRVRIVPPWRRHFCFLDYYLGGLIQAVYWNAELSSVNSCESQRLWKVTSPLDFADRRLKPLLRNFQHVEMNSFCLYSLSLLIDHLKYVIFLLVVFLRLLNNLSHFEGFSVQTVEWFPSLEFSCLLQFESLFCVRCGSLQWALAQLFRP